ncbi:hypothetical protein Rumeso_02086 [Rubellimicrobium mesophilum DSM 19309]|uniref:Uncharacterized protein n=2 Tax=Rubellimicrobium TaxID=295418 RepID=A0A017HQ75_9RHOB|nr:hypothetical protein Rumeso_02086 [Rubellimicrobium mesophilum DSM 19309]
MTDRVHPDYLEAPFFVEYAPFEDAPDSQWEEEAFRTRAEATERAQQLVEAGQCVVLGVIGTYQTKAGNSIRDYIYYWWNGYFDFPPSDDMSVGVPYHAQSRHVPFQAIAW